MTEDDKIVLREFLKAFGVTSAIFGGVCLFFILFIFLTTGEETLKPTKPVVVDTYENCDIIRWSTSQMAEYKYFLKCNE
jgi:hypothetical protein